MNFFVPCKWHFRHSLARIPHSHQQVVVVAVAWFLSLWNTFQSNFDDVGWVNENEHSILCFKKNQEKGNNFIKGWIFLASSKINLPAWPHSRFPDTAFGWVFLPLLEVFTQQSLSAGRNVQNFARSVEKQSFAQASWFSTIEPPAFPFPPMLMLWPE